MKLLSMYSERLSQSLRRITLATILITSMCSMQTAAATPYTWANTNVAGASHATTLNWFSGGPSTQGTWIGGIPVSPTGYHDPIVIFEDNTTPLGNTGLGENTQTIKLNRGGVPFQLRVLVLSGRASDTLGANLAMTLSGDPLHFSNTTSPIGGAIYMDGVNNVQTLSYNVNHPITIGTTAKNAAILTLHGSGSAEVILSGSISEMVESGGKIVKQGLCAVTLSGDSAISRGLDIVGGTIRLAGKNTSGTNTLNLRRGNIIFDLANGNNRWSGGTAIPVPTFNGGTLIVKGAPAGSSSQTLAGPTANYVQSKIIVDPNGGASTTLHLGDTWNGDYSTWGILFIDRSAPGAVVQTTATNVNNLIVWGGASGRLGIIVKDSTGFGFPTVIDGELLRYAGASPLQANSNSGNTSFKTSGNLTLTAGSHALRTVELDTSAVSGDLDLNTTSIGGALLATGGHDYTIRNGNYTGNLLHHFGTGTLTIDAICTIGLRKTGPGRVILNGMNAFAGEFKGLKICDGVAQAIDGVGLPSNQALYLIGGVFQSGGAIFSRTVDAATPYDNKVTWRPTSSGDAGRGGGFAAQGGTFTINLNAGGALEWGAGAFVQNDQALILGSTSADSLLDWQNPINLATNLSSAFYPAGSWMMREIQVDDNPSSATDIAQMSGALTGSVGGLIKTGDGTLRLTAANTYSGPTAINGGTVLVNGSLSAMATEITVNASGTLGGNGTINRPVTVYPGGTLNGSLGLTCGANLTLKNGAKLSWDANAKGRITVNGVLKLPTSASVSFKTAPATSLVLFESPTPIVGSLDGWTVTPRSVNLRLSDDSKKVLASGNAGTLIMLSARSITPNTGRYATPEESPAFQSPKFITNPLTKAYPGAEYNMRPAVTGGTWPYFFALQSAPAGMTIDAAKGTLSWQAPLTEQTVAVTLSVVDQAGRQAEQSFTITVTKTDFHFVSPSGDDSNLGTFESPWKTVMRAAQPVANASNTTLYLRDGTYTVDLPADPGKNNANLLKILRTSPRRWIAWPGEQPVIDLGWSEAQWLAALAVERALKGDQGTTQGYGHRINIDHSINDLLFDGLEVKNAAYYMFVMSDGNRSRLTWRRCNLHHLYGDYAENPAFIFTFAPNRTWEDATPGNAFPFGKRPLANPYRNLVVQDCTFADRPYDSPRGDHGGGIVWYVTEGCLVEDSRFERIQRGQCIIDKDNGWDNTYRNNVFLGGFMLAAQGCNDGINFHHNFVDGTLQIGSQPGWLRNVWIHHNSLRGAVHLMGGATTGPLEFETGGKTLAGPADPDSQALIRSFPLNQRLIFSWANAVAIPPLESGQPKFYLDRVATDAGFARNFRFVSWDGNLVDEKAAIAIGWSGPFMMWRALTTCGFDVQGASGVVTLDAEGHLPTGSPWRTTHGRDAGLAPQ